MGKIDLVFLSNPDVLDRLQLGLGYDSLIGEKRTPAFIAGDDIEGSTRKSDLGAPGNAEVIWVLEYDDTESRDHSSDTVSGKASCNAVIFSASAALENSTETTRRSNSVTVRIHCLAQTRVESITPDGSKLSWLPDTRALGSEQITPEAKQLKFLEICGDSFVGLHRYGSRLDLELNYEFRTMEEKKSFQAKIGGRYLIASAEVDIKSKLETLTESTRLRVVCRKFGGPKDVEIKADPSIDNYLRYCQAFANGTNNSNDRIIAVGLLDYNFINGVRASLKFDPLSADSKKSKQVMELRKRLAEACYRFKTLMQISEGSSRQKLANEADRQLLEIVRDETKVFIASIAEVAKKIAAGKTVRELPELPALPDGLTSIALIQDEAISLPTVLDNAVVKRGDSDTGTNPGGIFGNTWTLVLLDVLPHSSGNPVVRLVASIEEGKKNNNGFAPDEFNDATIFGLGPKPILMIPTDYGRLLDNALAPEQLHFDARILCQRLPDGPNVNPDGVENITVVMQNTVNTSVFSGVSAIVQSSAGAPGVHINLTVNYPYRIQITVGDLLAYRPTPLDDLLNEPRLGS